MQQKIGSLSVPLSSLSSIAAGTASLMDFNQVSLKMHKAIFGIDAQEALKRDWQLVGEDMASAIRSYEKETFKATNNKA